MTQAEVGSWHVDGHNMAAVIRKTVDGWETVARCPNENGTWREDTRLMAAAPDLLAVLKRAVANNMLVEGSDWWGEVFAAIAKAEGRRA